jgi:hypothetical protein
MTVGCPLSDPFFIIVFVHYRLDNILTTVTYISIPSEILIIAYLGLRTERFLSICNSGNRQTCRPEGGGGGGHKPVIMASATVANLVGRYNHVTMETKYNTHLRESHTDDGTHMLY